MSVIFINGIPVANTGYGYLDSYYGPQSRHLRDLTEAEDVEYEEIYEQPNNNGNENIETSVELPQK